MVTAFAVDGMAPTQTPEKRIEVPPAAQTTVALVVYPFDRNQPQTGTSCDFLSTAGDKATKMCV